MGRVISKERKNDLKQIQKQLMELYTSIQLIIDYEYSMAEFAKDNGIASQKIHMCTSNGMYSLLRGIEILDNKDIERLLKESMSPAEIIINEILKPKSLIILDTVEEDLLIKIMKEALNKNEYDVIINRYGFNGDTKTLVETADAIGISHSRVRQIEFNAIRKLRNPKYLKKLLPDYDLSIIELQKTKKMMDIKTKINNQLSEKVLNASIDELNLSIRCYNGLNNARIKTINQLSKHSLSSLLNITNLSKRLVRDIAISLEEKYGITLEDDLKN